MRHEINGTIEHGGERYTYSAIIWTGDDERRGNEVAAIEPMGGDLDEFCTSDLWDVVADLCLDDASQRVRLIAAAPEMLEALKSVINDCGLDVIGHGGRMDAAITTARAAIAKAEGGAL